MYNSKLFSNDFPVHGEEFCASGVASFGHMVHRSHSLLPEVACNLHCLSHQQGHERLCCGVVAGSTEMMLEETLYDEVCNPQLISLFLTYSKQVTSQVIKLNTGRFY